MPGWQHLYCPYTFECIGSTCIHVAARVQGVLQCSRHVQTCLLPRARSQTCMISRASATSGRVHLPAAFIEAKNIAYGQPVVLTVSGSETTYLCSASVLTDSSSEVQFDPSLQCGLEPAAAPLLIGHQQQVLASVTPVTSKVVTAVSVKVSVPDQLLQSAVPAAKLQQRLILKGCTLHLSSGICCQILEVSPAAAQGTVYRVVPSTVVQLTYGSSTADQPATAAASITPADSRVSGSSSSRPNSGRPTSAKAAGSSSGGSSSNKKKSSSKSSASTGAKSSSKSDSKSKSSKCKGPDSPEAAATASGSMFDLLNALGDD